MPSLYGATSLVVRGCRWSGMQRRIVQIAKMCVADVRLGDAVASDPNGARGWFVVEEVVPLTSGEVALGGDRGRSTITAGPRDVVGIQVRQNVEMAVETPESDHEQIADAQDEVPAPQEGGSAAA